MAEVDRNAPLVVRPRPRRLLEQEASLRRGTVDALEQFRQRVACRKSKAQASNHSGTTRATEYEFVRPSIPAPLP